MARNATTRLPSWRTRSGKSDRSKCHVVLLDAAIAPSLAARLVIGRHQILVIRHWHSAGWPVNSRVRGGHRHGMNLQVISSTQGEILWGVRAAARAVHDLTAARSTARNPSGAAEPAMGPHRRAAPAARRRMDNLRVFFLLVVRGPPEGVEYGDGVEVVTPECDLAVSDCDDGDKVIVVGVSGADRSAVDCVLEDDD